MSHCRTEPYEHTQASRESPTMVSTEGHKTPPQEYRSGDCYTFSCIVRNYVVPSQRTSDFPVKIRSPAMQRATALAFWASQGLEHGGAAAVTKCLMIA